MAIYLRNNTDATLSVSQKAPYGTNWMRSPTQREVGPHSEASVPIRSASSILDRFRSKGRFVYVKIGECSPRRVCIDSEPGSSHFCEAVGIDQYLLEICFKNAPRMKTEPAHEVEMAVLLMPGARCKRRNSSGCRVSAILGESIDSAASTPSRSSLERHEHGLRSADIRSPSTASSAGRASLDGSVQQNNTVSARRRSIEKVEGWVPPKLVISKDSVALHEIVLRTNIGGIRNSSIGRQSSSADSTASVTTSGSNDVILRTRTLSEQSSPTSGSGTPSSQSTMRDWSAPSPKPREGRRSLEDFSQAWRRSVCKRVPESEAATQWEVYLPGTGHPFRKSSNNARDCPRKIEHRDAILRRLSMEEGSDVTPFGNTLNVRHQSETWTCSTPPGGKIAPGLHGDKPRSSSMAARPMQHAGAANRR